MFDLPSCLTVWCVWGGTACSARSSTGWSGGRSWTAALIQTVPMKNCLPVRFASGLFLQVRHAGVIQEMSQSCFDLLFMIFYKIIWAADHWSSLRLDAQIHRVIRGHEQIFALCASVFISNQSEAADRGPQLPPSVHRIEGKFVLKQEQRHFGLCPGASQ